MRIPYGFTLTNNGILEINRSEADNVALVFDLYMAGASLGKVADMLFSKQIPSPTGKAKWTRAAVDHLLSNGKYAAISGLKKIMTRRACREKTRAMFRILCLRTDPSFIFLCIMLQ